MYIQQINEEDAEGLLMRVYQAGIGRVGSVATIIKLMSQDTASLRASMSFYVGLMKNENALSAPRREMLGAVVSNINDYYY